MVLILPHQNVSLNVVEARLGAGELAQVLKSLRAQVVEIQIPRFSFRTRIEHLDHALREQGLGVIFEINRADFSGISGEPPGTNRSLVVQKVVQEASIETDEGGTVATAATGVVLARSAMRWGPTYPAFRADRPFLFLIRDRETGAVVFIGRVVDPGGHVKPPDDPFLARAFGRRLG
jgi:serine protease inhibitor